MTEERNTESDKILRNWHWIGLAVLILFIAGVRIRLLSFPLERDEGEYAYFGQQILEGIPPYREAWNMKFPGTYFAYSLIMLVFGQSEEGIHVGLMLMNLATCILIFLLGDKISGKLSGFIAALFYGFLSLSPGVLGFAAHATHFVAFFAVAGFLLLMSALGKPGFLRFFLSGVVLGSALMMKQSGIFFAFTAILLCAILIFRKKTSASWKDFSGLLAGSVLPIAGTFLIFLISGDLDKFIYWTFTYASEYGSQTSFAEGLENLVLNFKTVLKGYGGFWLFVLAGFVSIFFLKTEKQEWGKGFAFAILGAGLLSILPGLYFRPHYFISLLPGISLGAGILFQVVKDNLQSQDEKRKPLFLAAPLGAIVLITLFLNRDYFFLKSPSLICREDIYAGDIFQDSKDISNYIRNRTKEGDEILVFGSEPQIYFYSGRKSAEGFLYTYPLMEEHPDVIRMQQDYAKVAEEKLPKYFIYCTGPTSWARKPKSNSYIFTWADGFLEKYYKQVGLAEVYADTTLYFWDEAMEEHQPPTSTDIALVHILQMRY